MVRIKTLDVSYMDRPAGTLTVLDTCGQSSKNIDSAGHMCKEQVIYMWI